MTAVLDVWSHNILYITHTGCRIDTSHRTLTQYSVHPASTPPIEQSFARTHDINLFPSCTWPFRNRANSDGHTFFGALGSVKIAGSLPNSPTPQLPPTTTACSSWFCIFENVLPAKRLLSSCQPNQWRSYQTGGPETNHSIFLVTSAAAIPYGCRGPASNANNSEDD